MTTDAEKPPPTEADLADLAARAESLLRAGEAVAALNACDALIACAVDSPQGYFIRARAQRVLDRGWHGLCDVRAALALARRRGLDLQGLLALADALEAQVATDPLGRPRLGARHHALEIFAALLVADQAAAVEEMAEALLPRFGDGPLLWFTIALARRARGRIDRALAALEQALAERPMMAPALYLRGRCLLDRGDVESALAAWGRLDELPAPVWPPPEPSWLDEGALNLLQRLPEVAWDERELYFERARLYADAGVAGAAVAVLDRLVQREPQAVDALIAKGRLLLRQQRAAEALAVFDGAAVALQPLDRLLEAVDPMVSIELGRSRSLTALGDEGAARAALERARALDNNAASAALEDPSAQQRGVEPAVGAAELGVAQQRARLRAALRAALPQESREAAQALLDLSAAALRVLDGERVPNGAAALAAAQAALPSAEASERAAAGRALVEVAAAILAPVAEATVLPFAPSG